MKKRKKRFKTEESRSKRKILPWEIQRAEHVSTAKKPLRLRAFASKKEQPLYFVPFGSSW